MSQLAFLLTAWNILPIVIIHVLTVCEVLFTASNSMCELLTTLLVTIVAPRAVGASIIMIWLLTGELKIYRLHVQNIADRYSYVIQISVLAAALTSLFLFP